MTTKSHILIIDDEAAIREIIFDDLTRADFTVTVAADAIAGMACLDAGGVFDAIVTDIKMAEMDGLEFLSRLRSIGTETPTILLTAYGNAAQTAKALRLGAFDFIEKPHDPVALARIVGNAATLGQRLRQFDAEIDLEMEVSGAVGERALRLRVLYREILRLKAIRSVMQAPSAPKKAS